MAPSQLHYFNEIPKLISQLAPLASLALVTGSSDEETHIALQGQSLAPYFKAIITANQVTHSKPHPQGYLLAAEKLGKAPFGCIAIEDSPSGIKAAKQAGMYCVAVTHTHSPDELRLADVVVDRLSLEIFNGLL